MAKAKKAKQVVAAVENKGPAQPELTPQQLAALKPVSAPIFYASSFNMQGTGLDFAIIFQQTVPAVHPDGGLVPGLVQNQIQAVAKLSPGSAKDLMLLLQSQIAEYEKDWGKIKTPFMKRRGIK